MTIRSGVESTHNLGPVDQIPPGEGKEFQVGAVAVAVFRGRDGSLFAVQARCPHRGGPLVDGILAGSGLSCPLHARRFDLLSGRSHRSDCSDLRTYRVQRTDADEIVVTLQ